MGISASCQPSYPRHNDFILLVKNANNFITCDKHVWTLNERTLLRIFFENLQVTLQNTQDYNLQLPWGNPDRNWDINTQFQDYFNRIRLALPKSNKVRKIFLSIHPGEDYTKLLPKTQTQFAQIYGLAAFLWSMYHDGSNASKYFYKSDILSYIYGNDCKSIETMMNALEKIYFTNRTGYVPANCLLIPSCGFRLIQGKINSFIENETITGPKTYSVTPNLETINEPFYTLSPIKIKIVLIIPPKQIEFKPELKPELKLELEPECELELKPELELECELELEPRKDGLNKIHEDINSLIAQLNGESEPEDWDKNFESFFDNQMHTRHRKSKERKGPTWRKYTRNI